jgi:high-affinity Fe2+/Pb2+ permease
MKRQHLLAALCFLLALLLYAVGSAPAGAKFFLLAGVVSELAAWRLVLRRRPGP